VRVTPQGDTLNSFIICDAYSVQTHPSVVFTGNNYIVVWADNRSSVYHIAETKITPQGGIPDTTVWLGSGIGDDEEDPDIAFDGNRCLVVWSKENLGVQARFIDTLGQPVDTVFTIAPFTTTTYTSPSISFGLNNYLVVWYDRRPGGDDWDVYAQLISMQGSNIGEQLTVATGVNSQYDARVTFDGSNYFVVWREANYDIYGRWITGDGVLIGSPVRVSNSTAFYRYQPTLAASDINYLIAWSEYHAGQFDIYGNVDIPVGTNERCSTRRIQQKKYRLSTIIRNLPKGFDAKYNIYDISGRLVDPHTLSPGVYFAEVNDDEVRKIVIIR